jgi:c-di-GMP-related signal transduction protein
MHAFIARQPIFDRDGEVRAYELLFRTGLGPLLESFDPEVASSRVISGSLLLPGLASLAQGRTAYINITRDMLVRSTVTLLPPATTVLEILESIPPDDEVLEACRQMRRAGYRLALDDLQPDSPWFGHLGDVDVVKLDVLAVGPQGRDAMIRRLRPTGVTIVAEKVETHDMHREMWTGGCQLFQGYFYAKPVTLAGRDIPASSMSCMNLLREVNRAELDIRSLVQVIEREVALAYKLLRYVNSALFGWRGSVSSIDHALALLGERELRRWAAIVALSGMAGDKPDELVSLALQRGRLCETVSALVDQGARSSDLFLTGLFSVIDSLLDCPMEVVLRQMPLADDVKHALLGEPGVFRDVLEVASAYLAGDWDQVSTVCPRLGLDESHLPALARETLIWCGASGLDGEDRQAA